MRRVALLILATLLAGCGSDDDEAATTVAATTTGQSVAWAVAFVRDGSLVLRTSVDAAGAPITPGLAFRRVIDRNPAFSPDGASIAFVSDRGELPQDDVYVLGVGGAEPRQLTNDVRIELEPVWLDTKTIAFVSCAIDFSECELVQVRATGEGRRRLRPKLSGTMEIAVARGGKRLVYAMGEPLQLDLYSAFPGGGAERQLTRTAGRDHEPAVALDGRIAFAHDEGAPGSPRDIYVLDSEGRSPRRLTNDAADDAAPAWSPDAERIAFVRTGGAGGADSEVWVMNADGTCAEALTVNERPDAQPVWDPRHAPGPLAC